LRKTDGGVKNVIIRGQGMSSTRIEPTGDFPAIELTNQTDVQPSFSKWIFQNLMFLQSNGESDLFRAKDVDTCRFSNVSFAGNGPDRRGNNLYCSNCYDWKFYGCHWAGGGDPEIETADMYLENNTNSFHLVNCRFERMRSYAMFMPSDSRGANHRISTTKFHGSTGGDAPDVPYIKGPFQQLQLMNCKLGPCFEGFLHFSGDKGQFGKARGGILVQNNQFEFHNLGSSPAITLAGDNRAAIAENDFHSVGTENPAVDVRDGYATIVGNLVRKSPIEVSGGSATVIGNNVQKPQGKNGIVVNAGDTTIVGNRVNGAGILGSTAENMSVVANVVKDGTIDIDGRNTATAANIVQE
jgi:hypothetical protein